MPAVDLSRLLFVCVVVLGATLGTVSAAGPATALSALDGPDYSLQANNNTTEVRHRNPENTSEDRNLHRLRGYLAGRMTTLVVDCTKGVKVGNFDACEEMNGSYPQYLERYVEVTGDTGVNGTRTADTFAETGNNTRQFQNQTQQFYRLYEEYQEAQAEGETQRARELARRLRAIAANITQTRSQLIENHQTLSNQSRIDTEESSEAVRDVSSNVSDTVAAIEEDLFVTTSLTVGSTADETSFSDPVTFTGEISAADDSPTSGSVVLVAGDQRVSTSLDSDGEFTMEYRPRTVRTGQTNLMVQYKPVADSIYLPSNQNETVWVDQVDSSTDIDQAPEVVRYGDTVQVVGIVNVDGAPVESIPVSVSLDGEFIGQNRTNDAGMYRVNASLPATVSDGEQTLEAAITLHNRAIGPSHETRELEVESTETIITLQTSETENSRILATGRLTTNGGQPVAGESVIIQVDGEYRTSVTTTADGRYRASLASPENSPETGPSTVRAMFNPGEGNLGEANAETQIETWLPDALEWLPITRTQLLYVAGACGLVLLFGIGVLAWTRGWVGWPRSDSESQSEPTSATQSPDASVSSLDDTTVRESAGELLSAAESTKAEEPVTAIQLSYAAVRDRFDDAGAQVQTHWEFYHALADTLSSERREALEQLTELYERASFSGQEASQRDSDDAVAAATRILGDQTQLDRGSEAGGPPDR